MHYFSNNFSNIAKIFDLGDRKIRYVAKFCFFKLIMTKSNFKKSVMTSWPLCNRKTSQNFSILSTPQSKFLATPVLTM